MKHIFDQVSGFLYGISFCKVNMLFRFSLGRLVCPPSFMMHGQGGGGSMMSVVAFLCLLKKKKKTAQKQGIVLFKGEPSVNSPQISVPRICDDHARFMAPRTLGVASAEKSLA